MPQTLDALLKAPTKEALRELLLRELQGIGFTRQSGFSPGVVSLTGQPNNAYQVRVAIIAGGNLGVATFQWSTDGGATYSPTLPVPLAGTFPIPGTALVITFAEGPAGAGESFLAGDVFAVDTRVPVLQATAWQTGSVPLSLVENDAAVLEDLYALARVLAAGGFLDSAVGPWLDLLAFNVYALTRFPGVTTVGTVRLTDAVGSGPFTVSDGQVTVQAASGQRFTSVGSFTLPQSGVVDVTVRAEEPGASYNVGNNTITALVTALPGVLVSNPPLLSGTWVTTQGADEESDELLRLRCRNRWPALGTGSPAAAYDLWAKTADSSITRTRVRPSPTVEGQVEVYLAGASGPAGPGAVASADAYIQPRVPLTVTALVQAAVGVSVPVTATLNVFSGFQTQALIDATAAAQAYFRSVDIGGTVYLTAIIEALMGPAGVRNVTVSAPGADVPLTPTQVAVPTLTLSVVVV
jgi:uncharacterized phage protein gp47/JayE